MRTSAQLTKQGNCPNHPKTNITTVTEGMMRASAQKQVVMRALGGEQINDYGGEVESILIDKGLQWENRAQRSNLILYNNRIRRFVDYERNRFRRMEASLPDRENPTVVSVGGEDIEAKYDYTLYDRNTNTAYVVRLRTGAPYARNMELEDYALGLAGKQLYPGANIVVQNCYLSDAQEVERVGLNRPYDYTDRVVPSKIKNLEFTREVEQAFEEKAAEEPEVCSPEECAGCSFYGVCHYVEPPLSINIEKTVKPISQITLTRAQRAIVQFEQGKARVNAGAGAGKTLVVAMRIVELLRKGYEPEDICLLTFTRTGADEMTARVVQYCAALLNIPVDPDRLTSTTFNTFCQRILDAHYEELGYDRKPRVIREEVKIGIINTLLDQFQRISTWSYGKFSTDDKNKKGWMTKSALTSAKKAFETIKKEQLTRECPGEFSRMKSEDLDILFQMYDEYNRVIHDRGFIEYDDQLLEVMRLKELRPTLFEELGFRHIIVDEFQDTDLGQIQLLNEIIDHPGFLSLMCVGDDSQAIFGFRHTSPEFMIHFEDYFGQFEDFELVENHRSTKEIIKHANAINEKPVNKVDKDLIATREEGAKPFINGYYTQKEEYRAVAKQIVQDIENGKNPSDIAFLASTKDELMEMASILTKHGVPSILMSPTPYKENSRVSALCAFYESYMNGTTAGLLEYKNVMLGGTLKGMDTVILDNMAAEFQGELNEREKSLAVFKEFAQALDENQVDECYQSFLENIEHCISMEELEEFFLSFKRYGDNSTFKREGHYEGICLTTIHSAKGLEWDNVYLSLSRLDRQENHSRYTRQSDAERDEDYRKWFVGVTRARDKLVTTGQYVVGKNRGDVHLNRYVKEGYELLGKLYSFQQGQLGVMEALEKQEEIDAAKQTASKLHGKRDAAQVQSSYFENSVYRQYQRKLQERQQREKETAESSNEKETDFVDTEPESLSFVEPEPSEFSTSEEVENMESLDHEFAD